MKMFIFISFLAYVIAEPPVGNGYPAARSSYEHHVDSPRSLEQEYGAPVLEARSNYVNDARSQLSFDRARSTSSQDFGTPGFRSVSREFGPQKARTGLSQEYSPPNARTGVSQNYGLPNSRSGLSQDYVPPKPRSGISQEYGTPNTRSGLSQQYGVPNVRLGLSQKHDPQNARSNIFQESSLPNSRSLSQQYSSPNLHNAAKDYTRSLDYSTASARLSQEYGTPQLRSSQDYKTNIPSDSYGTPLQRSSQALSDYNAPSEEYGLPSQRNFDHSASQKYEQPNFRNAQSYSPLSHGITGTSRFNKGSASSRSLQSSFVSRSPSQTYGTPGSTSYSAPSARNIDSYSPGAIDTYSPAAKSISTTYLPSSRSASQTYAAPDGRSLSSEYSAPDARALNTDAYASSFDTARSIPSNQYGTPSSRDAMPSEQYGVPEQYDALSGQGYSYARNALDELLNQEPANYDFGYKVSDYASGSDFGHTESRQENKAEGSYFVVLPDGTKQTVDYEADERGFKPRISVEPAESRSGYDDNAADLTRSPDGPY